MDYRRNGNTVYIRMDKGEEIVTTLKHVCEKNGLYLQHFSASAAAQKPLFFPDFRIQWKTNHIPGKTVWKWSISPEAFL